MSGSVSKLCWNTVVQLSATSRQEARCLGATTQVQFGEDVSQVILHRVFGDHELRGNLLVRETLCHELKHLFFTL